MSNVAAVRRRGLSLDYTLKPQNFGKQFRAAGQSGAAFALIYGAEEVAAGQVKLRNLASGSEILVSAENALETILNEMNS